MARRTSFKQHEFERSLSLLRRSARLADQFCRRPEACNTKAPLPSRLRRAERRSWQGCSSRPAASRRSLGRLPQTRGHRASVAPICVLQIVGGRAQTQMRTPNAAGLIAAMQSVPIWWCRKKPAAEAEGQRRTCTRRRPARPRCSRADGRIAPRLLAEVVGGCRSIGAMPAAWQGPRAAAAQRLAARRGACFGEDLLHSEVVGRNRADRLQHLHQLGIARVRCHPRQSRSQRAWQRARKAAHATHATGN